MSESLDAKAFAGLRAEYALRGLQLHRTDARDGPVVLLVDVGRGLVPIKSIEGVEGILRNLQGSPNTP